MPSGGPTAAIAAIACYSYIYSSYVRQDGERSGSPTLPPSPLRPGWLRQSPFKGLVIRCEGGGERAGLGPDQEVSGAVKQPGPGQKLESQAVERHIHAWQDLLFDPAKLLEELKKLGLRPREVGGELVRFSVRRSGWPRQSRLTGGKRSRLTGERSTRISISARLAASFSAAEVAAIDAATSNVTGWALL